MLANRKYFNFPDGPRSYGLGFVFSRGILGSFDLGFTLSSLRRRLPFAISKHRFFLRPPSVFIKTFYTVQKEVTPSSAFEST
jgi:hypothetical protein